MIATPPVSATAESSLAIPIGEPLITIVSMAYAANLPVLIEGPHGVGKSESVHEVGRRLGIPVIERDLAMVETSDIAGYPYRDPESNVTKFAPPDFLPKPSQPRGLLLLEELNRSSESTRHAALQILTARRIHDYELAPGWLPISTINPREAGKYFTSNLDAALLSRFVRVTVKADPALWLQWARGPGAVHPIVTEYISLLDAPFEDSEGHSNPRSWTYVSRLLQAIPNLAQADPATADGLATAVAGLVGAAHASAVMRLALGTERPLEPAVILADPAGWQATVRRWRDDGRIDMLTTSVRQLLRHLRPQTRASGVMENPVYLANLHAFFRELPPDVASPVRAFIKDTGYAAMNWDSDTRQPAIPKGVPAMLLPTSIQRMRRVAAASRGRNAANGQGRRP